MSLFLRLAVTASLATLGLLVAQFASPTPAAAQIFPPPPGALVLDFDDGTRPCNYLTTSATRNEYADYGISFSGPGLDGGTVFDQCSNFGVSGHSAPNFLGFNSFVTFSGGGQMQLPETLTFDYLASHVQFNAGSTDGGTLTAEAFNSSDISLGSVTLSLSSALRTFSLTFPGIKSIVISNGPAGMVVDDIAVLTDCGDGNLDVGEVCDDGNVAFGDCCGGGCKAECVDNNACTDDACDLGVCSYTNNTAACDDGLFCVEDEVCSGGSCVGTPVVCDDFVMCTTDSCDEFANACVNDDAPANGCLVAPKAALSIKNASVTGKSKLSWKWNAGDTFTQGNIGAPATATSYALCVYDTLTTDNPTLVDGILVTPSSFWVSKDPKGFLYKDKLGSSGGATKISLKPGDIGRTKVSFKAGGANYTPSAPFSEFYFAADPNVVVQLHSSEGLCWTSDFNANHIKVNGGDDFKAARR